MTCTPRNFRANFAPHLPPSNSITKAPQVCPTMGCLCIFAASCVPLTLSPMAAQPPHPLFEAFTAKGEYPHPAPHIYDHLWQQGHSTHQLSLNFCINGHPPTTCTHNFHTLSNTMLSGFLCSKQCGHRPIICCPHCTGWWLVHAMKIPLPIRCLIFFHLERPPRQYHPQVNLLTLLPAHPHQLILHSEASTHQFLSFKSHQLIDV